MAYTVGYLYNRFLDRIDKGGSTLYSPVQMMEILETATYGYISSVFDYNEINTTWKDLLSTLYIPYSYSLSNGTNSEEKITTIPATVYHIITAVPQSPGVTVRKVDLIRKGELQFHKINPNKKPVPEYPKVLFYTDTMAVYGCPNATTIKGFCLNRPVFGNPMDENTIAVNLPDDTVQHILNQMVSGVFSQQGDERYQGSLIQEGKYAKLK